MVEAVHPIHLLAYLAVLVVVLDLQLALLQAVLLHLVKVLLVVIQVVSLEQVVVAQVLQQQMLEQQTQQPQVAQELILIHLGYQQLTLASVDISQVVAVVVTTLQVLVEQAVQAAVLLVHQITFNQAQQPLTQVVVVVLWVAVDLLLLEALEHQV